jgi:hypothetical protein
MKESGKIAISEIKAHPDNAREHTDEQISKIMASIKANGWGKPIVLSDDLYILAGHGAVEAAINLGLKEVPYRFLEPRRKHDEPEAIAYMVADNKLTDESDWNYGKLTTNFEALESEGFDPTITGFDSVEIESINVDDDFGFLTGPETGKSGEDEDEDDDLGGIEGKPVGRSYSLHISFPTQEDAEKFLRVIGYEDFEVRGLTKLIDGKLIDTDLLEESLSPKET